MNPIHRTLLFQAKVVTAHAIDYMLRKKYEFHNKVLSEYAYRS
jgi:hypothetical protein